MLLRVPPHEVNLFVRAFGGPQDLTDEQLCTVDSPIDIPNAKRTDLATLFQILRYTKGAEIGVEQGEYSEVLLQHNPNLTLWCVDAWKAYRLYRDHVRQEKLNNFFEIAMKRLSRFGEQAICYRQFSMDAVRDFPANHFDFVYIDANHRFDFVMQDLIEWSHRVRPEGIVAGHDYIRRKDKSCQVVEAVNAYTEAHQIKPWFTLSGDVANGEPRSFFWVKP